MTKEAVDDYNDVNNSDLLVLINHDSWIPQGTGGKHTELGIALALGLRIILVGKKSQVFHHHPRVKQVAGVPELFEEIEKLSYELR